MYQVPFQRPEDLPATFGRYRVLKLLGKGGMGKVYLATDTQLDRQVALKIPHFDGDDDSQVLQRFLREARSAATILHPNVCPVHEVGEIDGVPYLTMGYIEGKPLSAFIAAKPLQQQQSALLVRKLALALAEAHKRGVIHRDLKPGNIMIDRRSEPIIMDFGLARRDGGGDARLTQQGTRMGTPAYMPPEQVSGDVGAMGPASDVYSLGVILYELLAGRLPFTGGASAVLAQVLRDEPPPPSRFRPAIDLRLEAICLKALAKKPTDRYASMTELAAALTDYIRGARAAAAPGEAAPPTVTYVPAGEPVTRVEAKSHRVTNGGDVSALVPSASQTAVHGAADTGHRSRETRWSGKLMLWTAVLGAAAVCGALLPALAVVLALRAEPPGSRHADARVTSPSPNLGTIRTVPSEPAAGPKNTPGPNPPPVELIGPPMADLGTITIQPSEAAADLVLMVDSVAAPGWGLLQLPAGEHKLEVCRKGVVLISETIAVQHGTNPSHTVLLPKLAPPPAAAPPEPAKLIVSWQKGDSYELHLMSDDGDAKDRVLLLTVPAKTVNRNRVPTPPNPAWSPDGKQIAFVAARDGDVQHIFVLNLEDKNDGKKAKQLTSGVDFPDYAPSWNANGKIAFHTWPAANALASIYVMEADGAKRTRLSPEGAWDVGAAWSPDGKEIVFASKRDGKGWGVYVMDAAGKGAKLIAQTDNPVGNVFPAWSPDGKKIAFIDWVDKKNCELFGIDRDGVNRKQLTKLEGSNQAPAWKPDGKQIAFIHDNKSLYFVNADGSGTPKEVLTADTQMGRPAWKPAKPDESKK